MVQADGYKGKANGLLWRLAGQANPRSDMCRADLAVGCRGISPGSLIAWLTSVSIHVLHAHPGWLSLTPGLQRLSSAMSRNLPWAASRSCAKLSSAEHYSCNRSNLWHDQAAAHTWLQRVAIAYALVLAGTMVCLLRIRFPLHQTTTPFPSPSLQ